MTTEPESDFFSTYKAVSSKLKKRFLKKPSVSEMSANFSKLARDLDNKSCSQYSGLCCVAMAKCEQSISNTFDEIEALIRAARYFINGDDYLEATKCPNFREHLRSAVGCYDQAINLYILHDISHLAGDLCVELGDYLHKSNMKSESLVRYQQSVELYQDFPLFCITSLKKVSELQIEMKNYSGALNACTKALKIIEEKGGYLDDGKVLIISFSDMHKDIELMAVFLLMFLNYSPMKISDEHSKILQKYTWSAIGSKESKIRNNISQKLFLLVQSFVMACSSLNVDSMIFLKNELEIYLPSSLNLLVQTVVEEYKNPNFLS